MRRDELDAVVAGGENQQVEFKATQVNDRTRPVQYAPCSMMPAASPCLELGLSGPFRTHRLRVLAP